MKAFIGTKIIHAEEMGKLDFENAFKEKAHDTSVGMQLAGYHVKYSNPDGSEYHSWSPKDVFERAYREVSADEADLVSVNKS